MSDQLPYGIKIFADGADLEGIVRLSEDPIISGFTTNPTLMRKSGVEDYPGFARKVLDSVTDKPISFEVFSDEFDEMATQARLIGSWGGNVFVKIPVTNTRGESSAALIKDLSAEGLHLNVTAILTLDQVRTVAEALEDSPGAVVSANFSYAFQCRFLDDQMEFEEFMANLWKLGSMKFRSVKSWL